MIQALAYKESDSSPHPTDTPFAPYLNDLNKAQREAVELTEGPVLILAGAGTGKTRALTTRLAHLLRGKGVYSNNVLAVTFTNKAAREMRNRVENLLDHTVEGMWLGTFHSICVRILRRNAELLNLNPDFTILDTDDQLRLIKQILKVENIDEKKWPPRLLAALISRWKDQALTPALVTPDYMAFSKDENPTLKIYELYQERLKILNAVDFGDLLMLCIELFSNHSETLKHYQTLFQYIMVDEYQDTNVAQYIWLRLLAQGTMNICCVGDEDQSIYGWRGAEISNILKFEKDFAGAKVVRLEQNYRSTEHILGAASGLISHNKARLGKTLWTQASGGSKIKVLSVWDGEEEARAIGKTIEKLHQHQEKLSQIVVLVRSGFQTREFEERFLTLGIPYRVIGGHRFYERQEIRDALAYLRIVMQPADGLAFERIINTPRRGIGTSTLQALHYAARSVHISLYQAAWDLLQTDEIRGRAKTSLKTMLESFERWRLQVSRMPPSELTKMVLDESGYTEMWRQDKSPDAPGRLENLKELVNALKEYDTLQAFLEHVSLVAEITQKAHEEVVSIMTLHSAKGLEFDHVFLAGWEEELFPHSRALRESGHLGLEEERRLAYVGITRARKQAIITHASSRRIHGKWNSCLPSRFIEELPPDHVEKESHFSSSSRRLLESDFTNFRKNSYYTEETVAPYEAYSNFILGERVFHQKFGYGNIVEKEGDKLTVNFECSGPKRVLASFIKRT